MTSSKPLYILSIVSIKETVSQKGDSLVGLFNKKIYPPCEKFEAIIRKPTKSLEASREEYILGSLVELEREGVDVSNAKRNILGK